LFNSSNELGDTEVHVTSGGMVDIVGWLMTMCCSFLVCMLFFCFSTRGLINHLSPTQPSDQFFIPELHMQVGIDDVSMDKQSLPMSM